MKMVWTSLFLLRCNPYNVVFYIWGKILEESHKNITNINISTSISNNQNLWSAYAAPGVLPGPFHIAGQLDHVGQVLWLSLGLEKLRAQQYMRKNMTMIQSYDLNYYTVCQSLLDWPLI